MSSYNRHRSRPEVREFKTPTYVGTVVQPLGSEPRVSTSTCTTVQSRLISEEMADVVTPGYEVLRNNGNIVNSPMTHEIIDYTYNTGVRNLQIDVSNADRSENLGYSQYFGDTPPEKLFDEWPTGPGFVDMPSVDIDLMSNLVILKAYAKIDEANANIYATIGESVKTYASVASIFVRLKFLTKEFLNAVSRIKISLSSAYLLSKLWLEYRYAIRPLMFEVEGFIKAVTSDEPLRTRFASREVRELSGTKARECPSSSSVHVYENEESYTKKVEVSAGVLVEYKIQKMAIATKLGVQDLPLGAWELIPFSFMVDWFFDVGTFLKSWTPHVNATVLASWLKVKTQTTEIVRNKTLEPISPIQQTNGSWWDTSIVAFTPSSLTCSTVQTVRTPNVDRPGLPQLKIKLSLAKGMDTVAIFSDLRKVDKLMTKFGRFLDAIEVTE